MKKTVLVALLGRLAVSASATLITHDPISMANYTVHEVLHYVQAFNTAMNTLRQYEQMVLQVERMGNPAGIANLVGLNDLGQLISGSQQLYANYQRLSQALDPSRYQSDFNSILSNYRLPTWQGFLTSGGAYVYPDQGTYQFDTASYNTTSQIVQTMESLYRQRDQLETDLNELKARQRSASTDAEVQKLNGNITLVQAALDSVNHKINQAWQRGQLQQAQIRAAQQIYRGTQVERQDAGIRQGVDQDFQGIDASRVHTSIDW
jgi:DNA integrity scanning protein DisA with diadenylate cyclase activity